MSVYIYFLLIELHKSVDNPTCTQCSRNLIVTYCEKIANLEQRVAVVKSLILLLLSDLLEV